MSRALRRTPIPICCAISSPRSACPMPNSSRGCAETRPRAAPMAELVGIYAASHGPLIARDWEKLPEQLKTRISGAFHELGRRLREARPDVIIGLAPDHW